MQRLLYLILGAPDSGRREIVRDILSEGLYGDARGLALTPEKAPQEPDFATWHWENNAFRLPEEAAATEVSHLFLILSPALDLADQMEAALALLASQDDLALGRILLVVHCGLLKDATPELQSWHDACAHFADVVLLNCREDVSNRTVKDFEERYRAMRYPFLVELVRKNRVANPARILDPSPRRISQAFDPLEEQKPDDTYSIDPYLERLPGNERAKPIPTPFGHHEHSA